MAEQGCNGAAATEHAENLDVFVLDAIDDDVVAHWEASQARKQIFVAGAAYICDGMLGERTGR
jgi:hypothetical protein